MPAVDEPSKIYYGVRWSTIQLSDPTLSTSIALKVDETGAHVSIRRPDASATVPFLPTTICISDCTHRIRIAQSLNISQLVFNMGGLIAVRRFGARTV